MAAADASDDAASGRRGCVARAAGPPAGSLRTDRRAAGVGHRAPRPLPGSWINNGFVGWDGRARIAWPERGLGLEIEASDALGTYVLYSPSANADFFCFEPVSHAVDAFHLPGGPQAHGLVLMRPGDSFEIECRFLVTEDR